jgi:hypothetical protein
MTQDSTQREEDLDKLTEHTERSKENDILRAAAKIVFKRTQQNPGSITIRAFPHQSTHVRITAEYIEL